MESKFLKCKKCNTIFHQFGNEELKLSCDGEMLEEIMPNTVEADVERHVPVAEVNGNVLKVSVGVLPHPNEADHFIEWIYVKNGNRTWGKTLTEKEPAVAEFLGDWHGKIEIEAYCSKHGIWHSTIIV